MQALRPAGLELCNPAKTAGWLIGIPRHRAGHAQYGAGRWSMPGPLRYCHDASHLAVPDESIVENMLRPGSPG